MEPPQWDENIKIQYLKERANITSRNHGIMTYLAHKIHFESIYHSLITTLINFFKKLNSKTSKKKQKFLSFLNQDSEGRKFIE